MKKQVVLLFDPALNALEIKVGNESLIIDNFITGGEDLRQASLSIEGEKKIIKLLVNNFLM